MTFPYAALLCGLIIFRGILGVLMNMNTLQCLSSQNKDEMILFRKSNFFRDVLPKICVPFAVFGCLLVFYTDKSTVDANPFTPAIFFSPSHTDQSEKVFSWRATFFLMIFSIVCTLLFFLITHFFKESCSFFLQTEIPYFNASNFLPYVKEVGFNFSPLLSSILYWISIITMADAVRFTAEMTEGSNFQCLLLSCLSLFLLVGAMAFDLTKFQDTSVCVKDCNAEVRALHELQQQKFHHHKLFEQVSGDVNAQSEALNSYKETECAIDAHFCSQRGVLPSDFEMRNDDQLEAKQHPPKQLIHIADAALNFSSSGGHSKLLLSSNRNQQQLSRRNSITIDGVCNQLDSVMIPVDHFDSYSSKGSQTNATHHYLKKEYTQILSAAMENNSNSNNNSNLNSPNYQHFKSCVYYEKNPISSSSDLNVQSPSSTVHCPSPSQKRARHRHETSNLDSPAQKQPKHFHDEETEEEQLGMESGEKMMTSPSMVSSSALKCDCQEKMETLLMETLEQQLQRMHYLCLNTRCKQCFLAKLVDFEVIIYFVLSFSCCCITLTLLSKSEFLSHISAFSNLLFMLILVYYKPVAHAAKNFVKLNENPRKFIIKQEVWRVFFQKVDSSFKNVFSRFCRKSKTLSNNPEVERRETEKKKRDEIFHAFTWYEKMTTASIAVMVPFVVACGVQHRFFDKKLDFGDEKMMLDAWQQTFKFSAALWGTSLLFLGASCSILFKTNCIRTNLKMLAVFGKMVTAGAHLHLRGLEMSSYTFLGLWIIFYFSYFFYFVVLKLDQRVDEERNKKVRKHIFMAMVTFLMIGFYAFLIFHPTCIIGIYNILAF
eukprot:GDKJ01004538.1.p1 GENE.GDKJ01004538.1~~GDKJ01004538.1.p1  ORF type:complete len:827 (+),score=142.68 GDKJ01004538.1:26-2506(+)